jgi:hypothetical protein
MLLAEVALHSIAGPANVGLLVGAEAATDSILVETEIWNWWRGSRHSMTITACLLGGKRYSKRNLI